MSTHQPTVCNQIFWLVRDHLTPFIGQLNKYSKKMNCTSLFKILLYSQISGKVSLRDIETSLECHQNKLYHLWVGTKSHSTISYWNRRSNDNAYEKMFYAVLKKYKEKCIVKNIWFDMPVVAMDSTLISLSLWLHDWAKHRRSKGWIRVHVWLELDRCIPRFALIKNGNVADNKVCHEIIKSWEIRAWECIVFDRYYVDFKLWKAIDDNKSYFVTRTKSTTDYMVWEEYAVTETGITKDAECRLMWEAWRKFYKKPLRIVRYYHKKDEREYEYITNNFEYSAGKIAEIYENRWRIEEFFRWIKQNLKIKSFLWTNEQAVQNQIRVAMIYYVIMHYLSESGKLGKTQILKFMRIVKEKCMEWIWIPEIYRLVRGWGTMSATAPPAEGLFAI
jgi:Transposase DDE domain/Domain of unknown function (DUF4372)